LNLTPEKSPPKQDKKKGGKLIRKKAVVSSQMFQVQKERYSSLEPRSTAPTKQLTLKELSMNNLKKRLFHEITPDFYIKQEPISPKPKRQRRKSKDELYAWPSSSKKLNGFGLMSLTSEQE
jgi:hypothetical protein